MNNFFFPFLVFPSLLSSPFFSFLQTKELKMWKLTPTFDLHAWLLRVPDNEAIFL